VSDTDDKTVEYTYDPSGQQATLKADLTGGGYQETKWVYGITSPIVSNDVLAAMEYPDPSTGAASSSQKDSYTYNQIGQVLTKTDRNGNVHAYSYDILGRQTMDAITTLGSGVDAAVRRIETAYDTQGNPYLVTSYDAASSGSVVNQIQRVYNGLGQMITEYQATNGAVNTSTSPKVQYAYSEMASGVNHSRLTSITYPNGRVITYNYSSGLNDSISRLSSITDGGTTLESYLYLGYGTVVDRLHPETGVDLTYIKLSGESDGAAGDKYTGLDAFGRVIDQRWTTSGGTAASRLQYGYDRDGNRLYAYNAVSTTNSELYTYDGLNQLTTFDRGTLNGGKTAISGSPSRSQSWDFDALGNFDSQTTNGTAQTRSANKQNEITSISSATTPAYDSNGNMTGDETGRTFKYDAWNRLVEVKNSGGTTLATYRYDGDGRRVRETRSGTTTDLLYSNERQVLEERVGSAIGSSYVWSPVFVDAMIVRDRDTDANGTLDERLYAVQNANYDVAALINTSGTVVERYAYDPFGVFTVLTGSWGSRSSSSYDWKHLYQGEAWDQDSGMYNSESRLYSPTLGRWNEPDPLGGGSGEFNLYRSRKNSPAGNQDPSGLVAIFFDGAGQTAANNSSIKQLYDASGDPNKKYIIIAAAKLGVGEFTTKVDEALEYILEKIKCATEEPIDLFGWSRGGAEAIAVADKLQKAIDKRKKDTGKDSKIRIRFIGLIDPVSFGIIGAPNVVPPVVENVWNGRRDGKHDNGLGFGAEGLIFPRMDVKIADPKATTLLGAKNEYPVSHPASGYDATIRDDLWKAATGVGVKLGKLT
jgi:RHS repeat-associated protein